MLICVDTVTDLLSSCGWDNLLVISILSRVSVEEHKTRTSLIAENSQSMPQVLISSDPPWNPQSLQGTPVGPVTARDRKSVV